MSSRAAFTVYDHERQEREMGCVLWPFVIVVWELVLTLLVTPNVVVVRENWSPAAYHCLRLWCRRNATVITSYNHDGEVARRACFWLLIHLGTHELYSTTRLSTLLKLNCCPCREILFIAHGDVPPYHAKMNEKGGH